MIDDFYLECWPILEQDGWRDFGYGHPFGSIWFDKSIAVSAPDLSARAYLFVGNNWHRIGLEVQHRIHGSAVVKDIGVDGSCTETQFDAAIKGHLSGMIADVQARYEAWGKEVDAKYGAFDNANT